MKITLNDRWDDINGNGDKYVELRINTAEACCVKEAPDGRRSFLEFDNGKNVYSWIGGADFPLRKLLPNEVDQIMSFVDEQFEAENSIDNKGELPMLKSGLHYDEKNCGYYYVSKNGIVYDLLTGMTIPKDGSNRKSSDTLFIMFDAISNFIQYGIFEKIDSQDEDDFYKDFDDGYFFVDFIFGYSTLSDSDGGMIADFVDDWEADNMKCVKKMQEYIRKYSAQKQSDSLLNEDINMKFVWDMNESRWNAFVDAIKHNDYDHAHWIGEFIGSCRIGDLCFDIRTWCPGEGWSGWGFELFCGGIDNGYSYSNMNEIPYPYDEAGCGDFPDGFETYSYEEFKLAAEEFFEIYIMDQNTVYDEADLIAKANEPLNVW